MKFKNESEFENYIRKLIENYITKKDKKIYALTNKKAVDIVICNDNIPVVYFIEVKYHKSRHGRLGFGSKKGIGYQPEILTKQPKCFEDTMRWIIGKEDNDKIYFLTNNEMKNYISGGTIGEKYNNIQIGKLFKEKKGLSEVKLISSLRDWVNTTRKSKVSFKGKKNKLSMKLS